MRTLFALALLALPACGYTPSGTFRPQSATISTDRVCDEAVEIGPDDVEAVLGAGGKKIGALSLENGYPQYEAAYFGGTHYLARSSSTSHTAHGLIANSHTVEVFDVYRVAPKNWSDLPKSMRPKK